MVLVISSGKIAGNKKKVILTFFEFKNCPIQFGFKPSQTIYLVVFGNFRLVFMKGPIRVFAEGEQNNFFSAKDGFLCSSVQRFRIYDPK